MKTIIRELKCIRKFSPFFIQKKLDEIIAKLQDISTTTDAVPVVRCKDCKWKGDTIGESWCDFHEFTILSGDDYCSYGERKDNEID